MTAQGGWTSLQGGGARGEWSARPRFAVIDFPILLWRERWIMLAVFGVLFVVGMGVALTMKRDYLAHSSVLVRLGQEYVYEPRAGDAARGAVPDTDQVLESEKEILSSDALKAIVVRDPLYAKIDPKFAAAYAAAGPAKRDDLVGKAVTDIGRNLGIESAPNTPVLRLSYRDKDPRRAASTLNALLDHYLVYRRNVLLQPTSSALEQQRRSFEGRLSQADSAYQDFLTSNQIGDFEAEKTSLSQLQQQIEQQQQTTEAQLRERTGRLSGLQTQLAQITPEIGLYRDVDNAAAAKLTDLKVQRESLLSRYRADSQPVKDIDAQIAQMQAAVSTGRAQGRGAERTGVNPVYQTLQTEKLQVTAEIAALQATLSTLNTQSEQLTERRIRLAELEPQYQALSRDRDVLQTNVRDFTVKEQQSQASQEIALATNDNIRVVQRAIPPTEGKSLKAIVAVLATLFAGGTALAVGLLRMFLRPGLPTPTAAARTLDLPVLGMATLKAA